MLAIILTILKWIGILLLCLISFLVLITVIILVFPVHYRVLGERDTQNMSGELKIRWLFLILRMRYQEGQFKAKFMWFRILSGSDKSTTSASESDKQTEATSFQSKTRTIQKQKIKKQKIKKHITNVQPSEGKETDAQLSDRQATNAHSSDRQATNAQSSDRQATDAHSFDRHVTDAHSSEKLATDEHSSEVQITETQTFDGQSSDTTTSDTKSSGEHSDDTRNPLFTKITQWVEKIRAIYQPIQHVQSIWAEAETKRILHKFLAEGKRLGKRLLPRKMKGNVRFGTGSPDTTGLAYGAIGMLLSITRWRFSFTPDFEEAVLSGRVAISGRFRLGTFLRSVIVLAFDKGTWHLIHKLRKEGMS
ncbi:MAG: DUF2953 domain-containing protein [Lachnospiraceae bacterium]|jgi:hypothetical protein|nr:DUF2953 domain-containing protein [Lachnospiraceae bacterium]